MSPKVSDAHKENRREQILEAAGRCFARKGYTETTMQEIFREAELSAGAVYNYFPSKLEIYMALMEHNLEVDLRRCRAVMAQAADAWSKLRSLTELYMGDFASPEQAEFFRLYLTEFVPSSFVHPELKAPLQRRNDQIHALFCEILKEGIASGEFRPLAGEAVAALIIAAGDGVRLHTLTFGSRVDPNLMYQTFLANLERALRLP